MAKEDLKDEQWEELLEDRRHHVLGVIAACWSEFIRTPVGFDEL